MTAHFTSTKSLSKDRVKNIEYNSIEEQVVTIILVNNFGERKIIDVEMAVLSNALDFASIPFYHN